MGLDPDGGPCRSPVGEQGTRMGREISDQASWPGPHPASPLGASCLSCVWYPGYFPFLVTRTSGRMAVPWVLVVLGGRGGGGGLCVACLAHRGGLPSARPGGCLALKTAWAGVSPGRTCRRVLEVRPSTGPCAASRGLVKTS